jgi:outer membrane lipoprotein SlyB
MSQVYRSTHRLAPGRQRPRRVTKAQNSRAGTHRTSRAVTIEGGRQVVIVALAGLAILDGFLSILIGLR